MYQICIKCLQYLAIRYLKWTWISTHLCTFKEYKSFRDVTPSSKGVVCMRDAISLNYCSCKVNKIILHMRCNVFFTKTFGVETFVIEVTMESAVSCMNRRVVISHLQWSKCFSAEITLIFHSTVSVHMYVVGSHAIISFLTEFTKIFEMSRVQLHVINKIWLPSECSVAFAANKIAFVPKPRLGGVAPGHFLLKKMGHTDTLYCHTHTLHGLKLNEKN